MIFRII